MEKPTLGHIDCPTCGGIKSMQVKHDKNGDPFGFCAIGLAACRQQLRIGGDSVRVDMFIKRFPWAGHDEPAQLVAKNSPAAPAPTAEKPVLVPAEKPKRSTFADAFNALGKSK